MAITNLSDAQHDIILVSEVPQGSLPMISPDYMTSNVLSLAPLTTKIHEYSFYFPTAGVFTTYPAAVTKDGHLVASSAIEQRMTVHQNLPKKELKTMNDILTGGTSGDILAFMRTQNILKSEVFKFKDIYGLLFDKAFYTEVRRILEQRGIFEEVVYSFAILHADVQGMKRYLNFRYEDSRITVRDLDIYYAKNDLLDFEDFTFREYFPLMNPRVHDIGEYRHNITNRDFLNTYITFLKYLLDKGNLKSREWLYLAIYFLLQDRVDDTLKIFSKIERKQLEGSSMLIQYDYLSAYLDLIVDPTFKKARDICGEYLTYPIYTWRNRFIEIANQIAECDGQADVLLNTDEAAKKTDIAKKVIFEASIDGDKVKVKAHHVKAFFVSYYQVDPEFTFSQDPMREYNSAALAAVKPRVMVRKDVSNTDELSIVSVEIPVELRNQNLILLLKTIDKELVSLSYYPSSMDVVFFETVGMVKVSDKTGKAYIQGLRKNLPSTQKMVV